MTADGQRWTSSSSGAAKARRAKAAQTASLNPPTLEELILRALEGFERRGQRSFYRSMLRSAVQSVDVVRPKRSFSDREAWKMALRQLQSDGSLLYNEGDDTVSLLPQPS